jgi:hypothetical protein
LIIEARVNDESLFLLGEDAASAASLLLIREICAIIGIPMPGAEYLEILEKRLGSFIPRFGYDELTFTELVLAFELNSTGFTGEIEIEPVKFSSKTLGIEYISKVLENYLRLRKLVDRKLQNHLDGYGDKMGF